MRTRTFALTASLFSAIACGAGHPAPSADLGSDTAGTLPRDSVPSDRDAGSSGTEPSDAALRDAGPSASDRKGVCSARLAIGTGIAFTPPPAGPYVGFTITPDELTAAWRTVDDVVTIHYADRGSKDESFRLAATITGSFADERIALTPDGLGIAVVDADRLGFSYLARRARFEAFGSPTVGPFQALFTEGHDALAPRGERYAAPLFARGGRYFIFARVGSTGRAIYAGTRAFSGDPFTVGMPWLPDVLGRIAGDATITSMSTDARALFVWDHRARTSRVLMTTAVGDFVSDTDLGPLHDLQAATDCETFYFRDEAAGIVFRSTL